MKNPEYPAFPCRTEEGNSFRSEVTWYPGLSKREHFAIELLKAAQSNASNAGGMYPHERAQAAVVLADALIFALSSKEDE